MSAFQYPFSLLNFYGSFSCCAVMRELPFKFKEYDSVARDDVRCSCFAVSQSLSRTLLSPSILGFLKRQRSMSTFLNIA